MGKEPFKIQPAVKKETLHIVLYTGIGVILMWAVLYVLAKFVMPETVPFDYRVILGGVGGLIVAVLNFFLMAVTVQKIAATDDEKRAASLMKASFNQRMLLQVLWLIAAIVAPCFYWIAGIAPLLFPSFGIKIAGIFKSKKNSKGQEVDAEQNGD